jgi:hypothetical protein
MDDSFPDRRHQPSFYYKGIGTLELQNSSQTRGCGTGRQPISFFSALGVHVHKFPVSFPPLVNLAYHRTDKLR